MHIKITVIELNGHWGVRCVLFCLYSCCFCLCLSDSFQVERQTQTKKQRRNPRQIKQNNNNLNAQRQQQQRHIIKHVNVTNSKAIRSCYIGRRQQRRRRRRRRLTANCDGARIAWQQSDCLTDTYSCKAQAPAVGWHFVFIIFSHSTPLHMNVCLYICRYTHAQVLLLIEIIIIRWVGCSSTTRWAKREQHIFLSHLNSLSVLLALPLSIYLSQCSLSLLYAWAAF